VRRIYYLEGILMIGETVIISGRVVRVARSNPAVRHNVVVRMVAGRDKPLLISDHDYLVRAARSTHGSSQRLERRLRVEEADGHVCT
jgi:hypothetical protein